MDAQQIEKDWTVGCDLKQMSQPGRLGTVKGKIYLDDQFFSIVVTRPFSLEKYHEVKNWIKKK